MGAPLLARRRVLALKQEAQVGTAESLTATEAAYRCYDLSITPNIQTDERQGQGAGTGPYAGEPGALSGTATFKMDLYSGTAWQTVLPACGLKYSTTFTPESRPPEAASSGAKTLTIGAFVDGLKRAIYGAMGNVVLHFPAGRVCYGDFTFSGCWQPPADVALPAYTPPTTAGLKFVSSDLEIGGVPLHVGELVLDLGNQVKLRESSNAASGYHSAVITSRKITIQADIEATLVGDYDPYGDWLAKTERAISWAIGDTSNQLAFSIPKAQVIDVQPGEREGIEVFNVTYQANAADLTAAPGDDELVITPG